MFIIKNCRKEHNIVLSKYIQIGTLNYYKTHFNQFIKDSSELYFGFLLEGINDAIILNDDQVKNITGGMLNTRGGVVIGRGGKFQGGINFPNVYVFCCSFVKELNLSIARSLGYDSYYQIRDPVLFSDFVALQLLFKYKLKKWSFKSNIKILKLYFFVSYKDDKFMIYDSFTNNTLLSLFINCLFIKLKKSKDFEKVCFEENSEYRFAWILLDEDNRVLDVADDPILIPSKPLLPKIGLTSIHERL